MSLQSQLWLYVISTFKLPEGKLREVTLWFSVLLFVLLQQCVWLRFWKEKLMKGKFIYLCFALILVLICISTFINILCFPVEFLTRSMKLRFFLNSQFFYLFVIIFLFWCLFNTFIIVLLRIMTLACVCILKTIIVFFIKLYFLFMIFDVFSFGGYGSFRWFNYVFLFSCTMKSCGTF